MTLTSTGEPDPGKQRLRLLSVNVGLPKDVEWRGRTVRTAIGKQPVSGRIALRPLNLDGDGQADLVGHGGEHRAVLLYQRSAYEHWARELGRDDLTPGIFGENLTITGPEDDEVCVGDRLRIGTALLEVTQPRVLCFKTGMALGVPRLPALMVRHGRPGFYCRVLEPGDVAAGDQIELAHRDPRGMTVGEVDALLYLPGHSPDRLRTALTVDALSEGWRWSFRALLDHGDGPGNSGLAPDGGPPPAWPGTRQLSVAARRDETPDVVVLELADPDGALLPAPVAGQHLSLHLDVPGEPRPVVRSYSIAGTPGGRYRLAVKREGPASAYLHAALDVGDRLACGAPRGAFALAPGHGPVVLLSAGVGVTPLLAMLEHLAEMEPDREIVWIHSTRGARHHVLAAEARSALGLIARARVLIANTGPEQDDGFDLHGRLDVAALRALDLPPDADIHLCGPEPFAKTMHAALDELGLLRVREEIFGAAVAADAPPPHQPDGDEGDGPGVTFGRSGLTVAWDDRHGTLLDLAEACDVPVSWSCRTGVCHSCESGLIAGRVAYDPPPLDDPALGAALLCCSQPDGPVVLDL
jgi:MOSC domain-containing protein YiiM/ferredoxin-NADP reductase